MTFTQDEIEIIRRWSHRLEIGWDETIRRVYAVFDAVMRLEAEANQDITAAPEEGLTLQIGNKVTCIKRILRRGK